MWEIIELQGPGDPGLSLEYELHTHREALEFLRAFIKDNPHKHERDFAIVKRGIDGKSN